MPMFFISYDLRKQRNYQTLYDELERYDGVRVLESVWCIKVNAEYEKVRDYFRQYIDVDDGILVIEATAWATYNTDNLPLDF
ncbi:CRISPR-associated endonuclease Cas2 [Flavobacterium sp. AG291]|uniref:CRISPR-associated endonuclease Cas2 n=1 Tax=Flavobacterium sp. AG291 TaxID=2184000 RepID=UPI000E0B0EEF|nr:CRISPR-associated endonuclease Cas2 [Flavobacterium sp. AG291]RDI13211.1 CRISPR associated protein Cas2 family [Flavobacterium sp. AG291]